MFGPGEEKLRLLQAKGFNTAEREEAEKTAPERQPGWVIKNKSMLEIPGVVNNSPTDPLKEAFMNQQKLVFISQSLRGTSVMVAPDMHLKIPLF